MQGTHYRQKKKSSHLKSVLVCIGGARYIISAFCSNILEGVFGTGLAIMGGSLLDAIYAHNRHAMNTIILFVIVFATGLFFSILAKDYLIGLYLEKGLINLKQKTIQVLNHAKLSWLDGMHTGELSSLITNDLNSLTGALRPVLIMGISVTVAKFVSLGYMLFANLKLTLIIFAFVPAISLLQWFLSKRIKLYKTRNLEAVGEMTSAASDCFGAHETVKSLSLENEMLDRFASAQKKQIAAAANEIRIDACLTPFSLLCEWLPRIMLLIFGGRFVLQGEMSIGQLMVFVALGNRTITALSSLQDLYVAVRRLSASCVRIAQLWEVPQERDNGEIDEPAGYDTALTFAHVKFAYEYNKVERSSLDDISFNVRSGELVAFVGESGCGKSTVLKLIASLYEPTEGNIIFLGNDVKTWKLKSMRERIAYVTQETFLFAGTVLENITCSKTDISTERIKMAVDVAGLSSFINSLPLGLDTQIGERGVLLSGGQRQRISIARAVVAQSEVLLLDEATSALDRKTENEVLSSLSSLPYRPAIIVVAHRLSTIKSADCIYVIEKGRIVERGTHEQLKDAGGIYTHMLTRAIGEEVCYAP